MNIANWSVLLRRCSGKFEWLLPRNCHIRHLEHTLGWALVFVVAMGRKPCFAGRTGGRALAAVAAATSLGPLTSPRLFSFGLKWLPSGA